MFLYILFSFISLQISCLIFHDEHEYNEMYLFILSRKMSYICWFQLLKSENLLLFFIILTVNEEPLGFELLAGQRKQLEDISLGSGR